MLDADIVQVRSNAQALGNKALKAALNLADMLLLTPRKALVITPIIPATTPSTDPAIPPQKPPVETRKAMGVLDRTAYSTLIGFVPPDLRVHFKPFEAALSQIKASDKVPDPVYLDPIDEDAQTGISTGLGVAIVTISSILRS